MSLFNTVTGSMPNDKIGGDPTVRLYGWDQPNNGLTEDLGQPCGTISYMTLDSMKHAIILNKGEISYDIRIVIPASIVEFIIILAVPGAVFVSRYLSTSFFNANRKSMCQSMVRLAGEMHAKVQEVAEADEPQERGVPEGTYFAIYSPQAATDKNIQLRCDGAVNSLKRLFKQNPIQFESAKYSPEATTVTITMPQQARAMAKHKTG